MHVHSCQTSTPNPAAWSWIPAGVYPGPDPGGNEERLYFISPVIPDGAKRRSGIQWLSMQRPWIPAGVYPGPDPG
ncbi:hypothetical protein HYR53_03980 [Candidatus Acetothermia bacterium]|nr:hypothetical protein [Candidatus Acetothermia bacterium]